MGDEHKLAHIKLAPTDEERTLNVLLDHKRRARLAVAKVCLDCLGGGAEFDAVAAVARSRLDNPELLAACRSAGTRVAEGAELVELFDALAAHQHEAHWHERRKIHLGGPCVPPQIVCKSSLDTNFRVDTHFIDELPAALADAAARPVKRLPIAAPPQVK